MFQKLPDIREVLTCKIEELGSELKEHYKIEAFTPLLAPAQEPVTLLGQIGCDSNGKLNNKSVILEGDREHWVLKSQWIYLSLRNILCFPDRL